jgi:hypothetical protein
MKVSMSIMAVPQRRHHVEYLLSKVGKIPVAWENGKGIWDTRCRAMLMHEPDATHHLVIQDDAIVGRGFKELVDYYVQKYPKYVISLYLGLRDKPNFRTNALPLIEQAVKREREGVVLNGISWGVGLIIPTGLIPEIIKDWENSDKLIRHDDTRIGRSMQRRKIPIFCTLPSLLDHRDEESFMNNSEGKVKRKAHTFIGEDDA